MLTNKQIDQFKAQLEEIKEEAEKEIEDFQEEQTANSSSNEGELSSVADHPGNLGTSQHEKQKDMTFYEQSREKLMEANDALQRIEDGTFGVSEKTGEPIPVERLEIMPTARFNVDEVEEERS
ncbi:hypothetical protein [Halobacillus campisalis]|uniref:DksA C4-type domain-containing protein n=1 Tax=Halobacillus campisalis TaxID=435909 RepID=A0ABW2K7W9_9BACI|nr:hypothetical protein [Halobacillus campisalis]